VVSPYNKVNKINTFYAIRKEGKNMANEKKEVKKLSLEAAMGAINKKYGSLSIFTGKENISVQVETRSSGCLAFDSALGTAIPRGRIIELAGAEGGGKTLFALSIIAHWQQKYGARCAFIDGEQTYSPSWAKSIGVNHDDLLYTAPDYLEQVLDTVDLLASTGEVDLIIYDSIAVLPSLAETRKDAGDVNVAALSKVLTSALRKLTPTLAKNKCTFICINQLREKIGAYSPTGQVVTTTSGGRSLKHASSLRLEMKKIGGSDIKVGDKIIGHRVEIRCKKNKLSSAQGIKSEFTLYYESGIDKIEDAITTATTIGVIERPNKSAYLYKDLKVTGYDNFVNALKENKALLEDLVKTTQDRMMNGVTFVEEVESTETDDEEDNDSDE
jgi:recombination protein RecA